MAFKKYLNKNDREDLLIFTFFCDKLEGIIENWSERKNLSATEKRDMEKALKLCLKSYESILFRLSDDSKRAFVKILEKTEVYLDLPSVIKELNRKRKCEINGIYEENEDFFKLVEASMERSCLKCKTKCTECSLFSYFESNFIPPFFIEEEREYKNCKYAYDLDFLDKEGTHGAKRATGNTRKNK